jgi:hypothetical protein
VSNYTFRPAQRSEAKPLIGLYSESGRGKTWSSLLLARGFVGPEGRIGMIETESGRGEIYVGVPPVGEYLVCPLRSDFSPAEYGKAITAAEGANLDALIIDSASHEWEGLGGVLSMAADNQAAGKKGPLVWQKPKMEHSRHFILRLMQTPIPLVIVNMRAKYPMKEVKKQNGEKEWIRSDELEPKQSEDILFEMMCHGWLDEQHKLHVTKYPKAVPAWKDIIVDGQPLSIETGQRLKAWAAGTFGATGNTGQQRRSGPTDDQIIKSLTNAKSLQELDDLVDLSRGITDAANKEKARQAYAASKARLAPNAAQPKESRNAEV